MNLPLFFHVFIVDLLRCFYRRLVTTCFVTDLLQRIVISSIISFLWVFVLTVLMENFSLTKVIRSNVANMKSWYFKHF